MNIVEFLEARISEDEAAARNAEASNPGERGYVASGPAGGEWSANDGMVEGLVDALWDCEGSGTLCTSPEVAAHMALHDPTRVLTEAGAKRAIIELAKQATEAEKEYDDYEWQGTVKRAEPWTGDAILHALAAIYRDHPDYQEAWG